MKPEATLEMKVEGLDMAIMSVLLVQYFAYKMKLQEYKQQRREMHETGKCSREIEPCYRVNEDGDLQSPDLSTACDFCTKRHALYLLIKSTSSKMRGTMTKIQRHVVRMPIFKNHITNNNEQE